MANAHHFDTQTVAKAYDRRSGIYDITVAKSEFPYHIQALKHVEFRENMKILEVATGPGRVALELLNKMDATSDLSGIDLSSKMIQKTKSRLRKAGFSNFELRVGDCHHLPWPDNYFDVVYNGYMMDLLPDEDIPPALQEFYRVLKPGGKLVLVNMSKENQQKNFLESIYIKLPKLLALYLMGNCRPVQLAQTAAEANFRRVKRTYLGGKHPSEIVTGFKPNFETMGAQNEPA